MAVPFNRFDRTKKSATSSAREMTLAAKRSEPMTASEVAEKLGTPSLEHLQQTIEHLFCVMIEFGKDQGLSARHTEEAFKRAASRLRRSPYRLKDAIHFKTLEQISEILAAWYRERAYLDADGKPKPLPVTGARSFATLAQRYLPGERPAKLAEMLVRERVLLCSAQGTLVPRRRVAGFAAPNAMMLDRLPMLLHGLFGTYSHNSSVPGRAQGTRCEASTTVQLPVELIPNFAARGKRGAQKLLDSIDNWARLRSGRSARAGTRPARSGRTARVGIEAFAFVDEDTPKRGRRKGRAT